LLAVADLPRSLDFWVSRLGGVVELEWDTYAKVRLGAGAVHLAVTGEPPPDRGIRLVPPVVGEEAHAEVVLEVADCRAVVEELEQRGVVLLGPASEPEWGGEVRAFARDPDGHLVEFSSRE
jgi:catechol 2,3-dioxygenase-like lactoylglutathione lyase family enzyme